MGTRVTWDSGLSVLGQWFPVPMSQRSPSRPDVQKRLRASVGPRKATGMRLDPILLEWASAYAQGRGTTRSAVIEAALREFRDLCSKGVPEVDIRRSPRSIEGADDARVVEYGLGSALLDVLDS